MNRREFILRTGAAAAYGVIPVRYYENCREFLNNHNQPLIVPPPDPKFELLALSNGGGYFQLHIGDPYKAIPTITWREYLEEEQGIDLSKTSLQELEEESGYGFESLAELDDDCPEELYADTWCRQESSNAQAFHYLECLDLGPDFSRGGRVAGSLDFIDGACPGNDYLGVHAEDAMSVSCLQERLNQLGERVKIVVGEY